MRKSIAAAASALAVAGGLTFIAPSASAATCTATSPSNANCDVNVGVTAAVGGLTGVRTIGVVTPVALAGATSPLTGALAVPVIETAAPGVDWSVTAIANGALTGAVSGGTIAASNLSVSNGVLPSGVGCLSLSLAVSLRCNMAAGAGGALDTAKTLLSVTGESTSTTYTGTYNYAGTVSLNVPNGTPTDTYTGSLTLTLVQ